MVRPFNHYLNINNQNTIMTWKINVLMIKAKSIFKKITDLIYKLGRNRMIKDNNAYIYYLLFVLYYIVILWVRSFEQIELIQALCNYDKNHKL